MIGKKQPPFIEQWETMRETKISFPANNINTKLREKGMRILKKMITSKNIQFFDCPTNSLD